MRAGSGFIPATASDLRVLLFGGKGGVGKTTISTLAALQLAETRRVVLFTTDPASNLFDLLADLTEEPVANLSVESLDADTLYRRFLDTNLPSFLELGDRGTYLDREELRRFFELSLPGVDELMAWMRIGELIEEDADRIVVVDTAPTGHTLRMLGAADHFRALTEALDAMQEKHRGMVRQFTRREVRDAMDAFIEEFDAQSRRRREVLTDPKQAAFVPVFLSEPWVVEQTIRLVAEVRGDGIAVPFAVLNRAAPHEDDQRCRVVAERDVAAKERVGVDVVAVRRACEPLHSVAALRRFGPPSSAPSLRSGAPSPAKREKDLAVMVAESLSVTWEKGLGNHQRESPLPLAGEGGPERSEGPGEGVHPAPITFLAGKGGVGKTTTSASIALQLALANPENRYVVISVDPAHSLLDVFAHEAPPANLTVEAIDTRAKWRRFRDTLGNEIERAVDALTPRGVTVAYDTDAIRKLIEIAPPGADELFAVSRLAQLITDESLAGVIVDTAPTGHFLRLLDLPRTAGEWVREFMRILLRYRDLIAPGSLGEELVNASRSLKQLDETLRGERAATIVVTRPERIVIAETKRLLAEIDRRGMHRGGVVANYVTPASDCPCDLAMRAHELAALQELGTDVVAIERRDAPPVSLAELAALIPLH
jgi:arsenite-transporting ATPase